MKIDLSDVKVGDRVFSFRNGHSKAISLRLQANYPIETEHRFTYMFDGRFDDIDPHPSLFHSKEEAIEYLRSIPEPLPDFEVDMKLLVKDTYMNKWKKRYFKNWSEDGKCVCFDDGRTSWSSNVDGVCWDEWKLPDV